MVQWKAIPWVHCWRPEIEREGKHFFLEKVNLLFLLNEQEAAKLWQRVCLAGLWAQKVGKDDFWQIIMLSYSGCFAKLIFSAEYRSVPFRASELAFPRKSECLGMSTFFRGITETVPSLFRGIFSEQNSVPNTTFVAGEDRLAGRRGGWGVNILEDERNRIALLQ